MLWCLGRNIKRKLARFNDLPEKRFAKLNREYAEIRINAKGLFEMLKSGNLLDAGLSKSQGYMSIKIKYIITI